MCCTQECAHACVCAHLSLCVWTLQAETQLHAQSLDPGFVCWSDHLQLVNLGDRFSLLHLRFLSRKVETATLWDSCGYLGSKGVWST